MAGKQAWIPVSLLNHWALSLFIEGDYAKLTKSELRGNNADSHDSLRWGGKPPVAAFAG
ncbi:hypothetical cytosolic protein [Syntrophus aciditrophicus SB]|uniref:Hypothetical cytosolic protein n=1 Tax=Syntrophus aciditrophicus (strain SB) TaxID=56780 RepID=Q2LWM6_SYNAS|nr:hypothetical cytosolic protein [Syntrophus aciditrophicus SB]